MNVLQRYNQSRDREQAAFDASPLAAECREIANKWTFARILVNVSPDLALSLAAEFAFGARMPAFYAGRAIGIW